MDLKGLIKENIKGQLTPDYIETVLDQVKTYTGSNGVFSALPSLNEKQLGVVAKELRIFQTALSILKDKIKDYDQKSSMGIRQLEMNLGKSLPNAVDEGRIRADYQRRYPKLGKQQMENLVASGVRAEISRTQQTVAHADKRAGQVLQGLGYDPKANPLAVMDELKSKQFGTKYGQSLQELYAAVEKAAGVTRVLMENRTKNGVDVQKAVASCSKRGYNEFNQAYFTNAQSPAQFKKMEEGMRGYIMNTLKTDVKWESNDPRMGTYLDQGVTAWAAKNVADRKKASQKQ